MDLRTRIWIAALVALAQPAALLAADARAIVGVGHASVSAQSGDTLEQRRLMAMRASKLLAARDLVEQLHGLAVKSDSFADASTVRLDSVRAHSEGVVRGARTVRITPKGKDSYEAILELAANAGGQ